MKKNILEIKNISKSFDDTAVLHNLDLQINAGEFITLLGPSGCGKTTLLRIIAGLETPDYGSVFLEGNDVSNKPPNKRSMSMVFQNYALFPHMTVGANIAYSLKLKKASKATMKDAVCEALSLVRLEGYEDRMPNELSGGQKQRVAIARSIVSKPKLLLLDEPLGALDLQLRHQMQVELKKLQKQLGITFIYITHDQEEALNMSSRIVVMRDGTFEQIGSPTQVYDNPLTSYVATFVGNANIIDGTVQDVDKKNGIMTVICKDGIIPASTLDYSFTIGDKIRLAIRSENIIFSSTKTEESISAKVTEKTFTGGQLKISLKTGNDINLIASRHGINSNIEVDDKVYLSFNAEHVIPIDVENPKIDYNIISDLQKDNT